MGRQASIGTESISKPELRLEEGWGEPQNVKAANSCLGTILESRVLT